MQERSAILSSRQNRLKQQPDHAVSCNDDRHHQKSVKTQHEYQEDLSANHHAVLCLARLLGRQAARDLARAGSANSEGAPDAD
jgi:hypothetical protein